MLADPVLVAAARRAIADGLLPSRVPGRSWAGYGAGETCRLCGRPIVRTDISVELDAPGNPVLHRVCEYAWERAVHAGTT